MLNLLSNGPDLGIDLGTSHTPVVERGRGVTLLEPSYVAIDRRKGKVVAVGSKAKRMDGRCPEHIRVVKPVRDGVIADYDVAEALLRHLLTCLRRRHPRVLVGIPTDATEVERRAVSEAAREAGARTVFTLPQPLVAAVGVGLPVLEARGSMVVDIGGGTSEAAMVSLGGIVSSGCVRSAGDRMDQVIQAHLRRKRNLLVGERSAEQLKLECGAARALEEPLVGRVRGRDLTSGLPRSVEIDSHELAEVLAPSVAELADLVRTTMEGTPPELVGHVMESGIALCGGGALLRGLDHYLSEATGVYCYKVEEPLTAVARGAGTLLADRALLKALLASHGR